MSALMPAINARADALGIPLSAHLDVTYRCNERCVHCYLDHHDRGEMTLEEIRSVLRQMADAGTLFLTLSGGEVFMRPDFLDIVAYARALRFSVRIKTNAVLIGEREAGRLLELGVQQVQVSVYSDRPEVHDGITKLPGSFVRTVEAIARLKRHGVRVVVANALMTANFNDYPGVRALAASLGAECTIDPTITPHIDGDRSLLALNVSQAQLASVFRDTALLGPAAESCAVPEGPDADVLDSRPCSAGHSSCYVSPYGDVYPCVQFPLPTGNVRQQPFLDIWRGSSAFADVHAIRIRDLSTCPSCAHAGSCTRCPGLAYMEGSMRGPSSLDCAKSFAKTGVVTAGMMAAAASTSTSTPSALDGVFIPLERVGRASGPA